MEQEKMEYDVVIVGAGPSGLAAGIRLKQLAIQNNVDLKVCILEKGAQVGAHILSGAVLEPRALQELLPNNWQEAPLNTPVKEDFFYYLSEKKSYRLPVPAPMKNHGNYIISLSELCQYLAGVAESLGCEIYPGFPAVRALYNQNGQVIGVATGDLGLDKKDNKTINYQPGMHLYAKQTLLAEGCRGQLSQYLINRFQLNQDSNPQTYGLGIKEIWKVSKNAHRLGEVVHTIGWPLNQATYGGSFIYHLNNNRVAIGLVIGLDYKNPWLNPYAEFQRFKTHPYVANLLNKGERIAYGARALNEGGYQSMPKLTFPGGALIGDAAGFLNVAKIKGIHTAMQSGMYAAETCFQALKTNPDYVVENIAYTMKINKSWVMDELYKVRNIRPGFHYGLFVGLALAAFDTYITKGKSPWTLKNHADNLSLKRARVSKKIVYPKPDGKLSFDIASSVYLSNTYQDENQPCHLKLKDKQTAISINYKQYASPETRYCPAQVYEIVEGSMGPRLQINAQNCIHCKTCDIKDPTQNIIWTAPEGGGGPNYIGM